ncbi:hypothetical protein L227DRAFT_618020 [Lentinus tigrinus ALCF2SS1-6]|uniref:Uncharacterized protein n=1 Tax=Lentinus tigrinus ALCF2SS1-6 TaxID=1328759 RepID=A0A5C2RKW1_9APHY|nr:hypothetical protein L227DRAFT_618020 [Lentinus tigrinus ALCF2SS1-6]
MNPNSNLNPSNMAVDNDSQNTHHTTGGGSSSYQTAIPPPFQQQQHPGGTVTFQSQPPFNTATHPMQQGFGGSAPGFPSYQTTPMPPYQAAFPMASPATSATTAAPPNMPPLMPIPMTTPTAIPWTCPDTTRMCMVHMDPRCTTCASYMQHVVSAAHDTQFLQAHEEARAAQQAAYWEHLRRWQASRGEGSGEEQTRLRQEIARLQGETKDLKHRVQKAREAYEDRDREVKDLRLKLQDRERDVSELHRRLESDIRSQLDEERRGRRDRSRLPARSSQNERYDRREDRYTRYRPSPPRAGPSRRDQSPPRTYRPSRRDPSPSRTSPNDRRAQPGPSRAPEPPQDRRDGPGTSSGAGSHQRQTNPQVRLPSARIESAPRRQEPERREEPQPRTHDHGSSSSRLTAGLTAASYDFLDDDDDDWSDNGGDEADAIDLDTVRKRHSRQVYRGYRKAPQLKGKAAAYQSQRERFTPPPGEAQPQPQPLPLGVPAGSTPESCKWPDVIKWPTETDVRMADQWYRYVPVTTAQAVALLEHAKNQGDGALARVKHLIRQVDTNNGYMGVAGLKFVKENWRNADKEMKTPTHFHPPQAWSKFFARYPINIPRHLMANPPNDTTVPPIPLIEGNSLLKRFVPTSARKQPTLRASMLENLVRVFSVHGLYHHLRNLGQYPIGVVENIQPYPLDVANVSEFDIVRWAARCGITDRSVLLIENVARRMRNLEHHRPVDCIEPWPTAPRSLDDITQVPTENELPALPDAAGAPLPVPGTSGPALVSERGDTPASGQTHEQSPDVEMQDDGHAEAQETGEGIHTQTGSPVGSL